jgi:two-component system, NtrC family, nitrogen regulation response regulator NtrX
MVTMDKTILLVDDDPMVLNCLCDLLQRSGYTVIAEREASAALADSTTGANIDLVITDYQMAGMDGLEFLHELRRMHPTIPAIMVTGHDTLENYQKAIGLGTTAFLTKPFRARELLRVVAIALGDSADACVSFASS